jgi:fatty-acyl-CoA synthase
MPCTDRFKLSPEDLPLRLSAIAGVAESAVIGVKDARWGERPLALIVRDPKTTPPVSEEDIKSHVLSYSKKGEISKFAVPQKILFVEALAIATVF